MLLFVRGDHLFRRCTVVLVCCLLMFFFFGGVSSFCLFSFSFFSVSFWCTFLDMEFFAPNAS